MLVHNNHRTTDEILEGPRWIRDFLEPYRFKMITLKKICEEVGISKKKCKTIDTMKTALSEVRNDIIAHLGCTLEFAIQHWDTEASRFVFPKGMLDETVSTKSGATSSAGGSVCGGASKRKYTPGEGWSYGFDNTPSEDEETREMYKKGKKDYKRANTSSYPMVHSPGSTTDDEGNSNATASTPSSNAPAGGSVSKTAVTAEVKKPARLDLYFSPLRKVFADVEVKQKRDPCPWVHGSAKPPKLPEQNTSPKEEPEDWEFMTQEMLRRILSVYGFHPGKPTQKEMVDQIKKHFERYSANDRVVRNAGAHEIGFIKGGQSVDKARPVYTLRQYLMCFKKPSKGTAGGMNFPLEHTENDVSFGKSDAESTSQTSSVEQSTPENPPLRSKSTLPLHPSILKRWKKKNAESNRREKMSREEREKEDENKHKEWADAQAKWVRTVRTKTCDTSEQSSISDTHQSNTPQHLPYDYEIDDEKSQEKTMAQYPSDFAGALIYNPAEYGVGTQPAASPQQSEIIEIED